MQSKVLTLKIESQGHGQGQSRLFYLGTWVKSICLLFVAWQSDLTLKIEGQGHGQGQTWWSHLRLRDQSICLFSFRGNRTIFGSDIYSKFHIWPWKFQIKLTTKLEQNLIRSFIRKSHQSCQKWKKSEKLFGSYRVKTKVCSRWWQLKNWHKNINTPGIPGYLIMIQLLRWNDVLST